MCTLSYLPLAGSQGPSRHLAFNRDELLSRGPEAPPQLASAGPHAALWPRDTVSNGTWLGANDRGLAAFLLNANPADPSHPHPHASRGLLVPTALAAGDVGAAVDAIRGLLEPASHAWFRLALVGPARAVVLAWLPRGPVLHDLPTARPWMLTSSSLGDDVVGPPREALFRETFGAELAGRAADAESLARQRAFHAHQWPDRLPLSVNMRRDDADTRSYCELAFDSDYLHLRYQAAPPPLRTPIREWTLPLVKD